MKNWLKIYNGNFINGDYVTQIYVMKVEEKWKVLGDIAGKEAAYILSPDFDNEKDAQDYKTCLDPRAP